jgi:hypothetical protein
VKLHLDEVLGVSAKLKMMQSPPVVAPHRVGYGAGAAIHREWLVRHNTSGTFTSSLYEAYLAALRFDVLEAETVRRRWSAAWMRSKVRFSATGVSPDMRPLCCASCAPYVQRAIAATGGLDLAETTCYRVGCLGSTIGRVAAPLDCHLFGSDSTGRSDNSRTPAELRKRAVMPNR